MKIMVGFIIPFIFSRLCISWGVAALVFLKLSISPSTSGFKEGPSYGDLAWISRFMPVKRSQDRPEFFREFSVESNEFSQEKTEPD